MRLMIIALALAAPAVAFADTCPDVPERGARYDALMKGVRTAPNENAARQISNELWEIWANAPDTRAQALLDEGMQRRAGFDFDGAIIAFDALVEYCPDYAEGYNQRAFVNFIRGEYALALDDLDLALERDPVHIAALSGRALTLMGMGQMDDGQDQLRAALELNPWLPERNMLVEPAGDDI
ncbi:tetratricopeptide repeat protein [Aliiroseovarius sp. YM-037]|uniref:tetratricopeptide repeat protein n=1 Tax=Aliiroseovarius sp. YM-037 TaxID=3341728 RepID=UPI003A806170